MTIRVRIILLVLLPVLLALIVAGAFSASTAQESAIENMDKQSDIVNKAYSVALTQSLGGYTAQVEAIAREAGFFAPDATDEEKVQLLQRHAASTDVENIGIFGEDGKNIFIAYADGTTVPVGVADISSRPYLPRALNGETVVFGPSKDVVTGNLTITIATRTLVPDAPASIIAIDFELDFIEDVVAEGSFGSTGYSFLLDRDGMIIAHPSDDLIGTTREELTRNTRYANFAEAVATSVASSGSGNAQFELDGEESYATYNQVEGSDGWVIISAAHISEYMQGYNDSIRTQLLVLVAFLVAAVVFALFIGKRMSDPIRFVADRVIALSEGDLTQVPDSKASRRSDEIGSLARALDSAVETLHSYVDDISVKLGQVAGGDLDVAVSMEYKGDFAPIRHSLQQIVDSLNAVMQQMNSAAAQVAFGSEQIAQASQGLASGSTQQAAAVQQFSDTIFHVNNMADTNTKTAADALAENQKAEELMGECMAAMRQTVDAMQAINDSSQNISKIIKVIDDIAFQTNILALNAAVEAARAGQHGKGFAVVAEEVRSLAAKSAEAAKETTVLIEQSTENAEKGSEIVAHVDERLQAIAEISQQTAKQISEMDEGSRRQSEAMGQVNSGISQISSVVQSNSAMAEQTAASAEEMSAQASTL
ncbi:methyl-accepting chemotaxis protein, partial [Oscillospiraceae bacterium OttesenSCG-928-G22]|nr:methyl-accepting chemotaxis protein [Oscillospiraceae bacterium OttesenSCG-928-G22]